MRLDVEASLDVDEPKQAAVGCRCNHEEVPIRIEEQGKPRRDVARACGISKLADKRGDRSGVIDRGWSEGDSRGGPASVSSVPVRFSMEVVDRQSIRDGTRGGMATQGRPVERNGRDGSRVEMAFRARTRA